MIRSTFLFLYLFFIIILGFSQDKPNFNLYPNYGLMQYTAINENSRSTNEIYLDIRYLPGKIITKKNIELDSFKFRYNITKDVIECKIGRQHSTITYPQEIKNIDINDNCFEYQKHLVRKDTIDGYLLKLNEGDKALYAKYYVNHHKILGPVVKSYILLKNNGELPKKIYSVKSTLASHFKNQKKAIQEYENRNHINWNNPMDLKKLFNYLSNLKETT